MNKLVPLFTSAFLFASASSLVSSRSDTAQRTSRPDVKLASSTVGSGSECLAGCEGTDGCINNNRWKKYFPHYECRFSWMPYTCENKYGDVACNKIYAGCPFGGEMLDETKTGMCSTASVPTSD